MIRDTSFDDINVETPDYQNLRDEYIPPDADEYGHTYTPYQDLSPTGLSQVETKIMSTAPNNQSSVSDVVGDPKHRNLRGASPKV